MKVTTLPASPQPSKRPKLGATQAPPPPPPPVQTRRLPEPVPSQQPPGEPVVVEQSASGANQVQSRPLSKGNNMLKNKLRKIGTKVLPLEQIVIDPEIQSRAEKWNPETVFDYMERFSTLAGLDNTDEAQEHYDATRMPRMEVVISEDGLCRLASGFNRYESLRCVECKYVPVDLYEGDKSDAQYISMTANNTHGLRRSKADKRRAVEMALYHPWMRDFSNRSIADELNVGDDLVADVRKILEKKEKESQQNETKSGVVKRHLKEDTPPATEKRKGKDGKLYPVKPKVVTKDSAVPAVKQTTDKPKPKPQVQCDSTDNSANKMTSDDSVASFFDRKLKSMPESQLNEEIYEGLRWLLCNKLTKDGQNSLSDKLHELSTVGFCSRYMEQNRKPDDSVP